MEETKSLFTRFREIYKIMAENIPFIMEEAEKPFCKECRENFIERMKQLEKQP